MFLKGLYTALITPFDASGHLDENGLRQIIRYQIQSGVDGIVLLGTTGEDPTLLPQEKERVIQIGVEEAKGKITLLVGTGSYSTQQTIENTRRAKRLGADAALVVTPYYNKPTQEGLFLHFQALSQAVDFPFVVYNISGRTGQNLLTSTLKRISSLPNYIGVKESSGNLLQIDEVIQAFKNQPSTVLSGDDTFTFPLMALGGHGIISVASNLVPKPIKKMVDACAKGDMITARNLHQQLYPLFNHIFIETNPIPIKTAMNMRGLPGGLCRLPLCNLIPDNETKLKSVINSLPSNWF